MFEPSAELARAILKRAEGIEPGVLHPGFVSMLRQALLPSAEYLAAAQSSHAPISDLRVRRDTSSQQLLRLNLRALHEVDPAIDDDILRLGRTSGVDSVVASIQTDLTGETVRAEYARDVTGALARDDGLLVFVALSRYVNVFGSWWDAGSIAASVAASVTSSADVPELVTGRAALLGLSGIALALNRVDGADRLLWESMETHPSPIESYFTSLRFASIKEKRENDPAAARAIIRRGEEIALATPQEPGDDAVIRGMTTNFLGLLAVRSGERTRARELIREAVRLLPDEPGRTVRIADAEALRYAWMARFNQAQLALFAEDYELAERELREVAAFARAKDRGALHTTLSTLGFCLIKTGRPAEAIPVLHEALELLREEYDPSVVTQARKLLFKARLELGDEAAADAVEQLSPYFWRVSGAETEQPRVD